MLLIGSIILAVVMIALAVTAKRMLIGNEGFSELDTFDKYVFPGAMGLMVGAINYFSPKLETTMWLGLLFVAVLIGLLVYIVKWWNEEGGSWKEMIPFILMVVLIFWTMKSAAFAGSLALDTPFLTTLVRVIPAVSAIVAIWCMIWNYLKFEMDEMDSTDGQVKKHKGILTAASVVAIALLITALATQVNWAGLSNMADMDAKSYAADSEDGESVPEWTFYNLQLQDDSDEDNDFNFGPNPGKLTATQYNQDFRDRLRKDPALGAADMAWADAWLGTRYLGEFYESCNEDWAKTINAAKATFMKDPELYNQTLDAFFKMLDTAKVKVTSDKSLDDQMYMNPYTVDYVPDVIVMATPNHKGTFLTYVFTIKGTKTVEVSYRTECGYQPTNVQEVMGITPQSTPSKPNKPGKPSKPNKPGGSGDPSPTPDKPKYNKDPSKAPSKNTEPNDDPGPGPNTNNPSDPQHSTEDTKDSSTSGSYQDYKNNVDKLKDTNSNQKTGNDNNKPSTPAPKPDTNTHNNGDSGTGNGGANKPTPTSNKAKEADSGKEIKDSAGDSWGGPSD